MPLILLARVLGLGARRISWLAVLALIPGTFAVVPALSAAPRDIGVVGATPTPDGLLVTASSTPTETALPSPSPSASATATITPTASPTATASPSPTRPSYVAPVGVTVATAYPTALPARKAAPQGNRAPAEPGYQVGAYYFSGWSRGQNDNLSPLLLSGPLRRYEPLNGWYDDTQSRVDRSIVQAANAGISFFAFDWYDLARSPYASDQTLNNGLRFYLTSRQRSRLQYCILFVDQAPFIPRARDWPGLVHKWLRYFRQPDYVRVDGKPLFIVFSPEIMRQIFGTSANVHLALDYLRAQARRHGLPGITVAVAATVTAHGNPWNYGRLAQEGYDVTTGYNYHDVGGEQPNRPIPYRRLVQDNEAMWQRVATHLPQPYIPVVTTGWDQRFSSREQRRAFFYTGRTPEALTCYMDAARRWVDEHPTRTVPERIVLLFAWNEIGEGGALIPNRADGYAYTNAVRRVFGQPPVGPPLTGCH